MRLPQALRGKATGEGRGCFLFLRPSPPGLAKFIISWKLASQRPLMRSTPASVWEPLLPHLAHDKLDSFNLFTLERAIRLHVRRTAHRGRRLMLDRLRGH